MTSTAIVAVNATSLAADFAVTASSSSGENSSRATLKLTLAFAYLLLFIVGTIGNGIVIVMILNVLTSMRRGVHKRRLLSNTNHVFIYVLGLSISDLLVILHLPFLVADLLKGQWLFGTTMCKLYWFGESVNKLLSSFLMTVLSWDRYLAVCSPVKSMRMRSNRTASQVLLGCTALATVLLLPVLVEATVHKIDKIRMIPLMEGTPELEESDLRGSTISKCMFDADAAFTLYTFVAGFVLPALLITIFYSRVIYVLQMSSRNIRGARSIQPKRDVTSHRVRKVTKRIIAVILFYFLCWTPQWSLNVISQFNLIHVSWLTPALSAMFFVAHLLVAFNSAANPVLYALINRELRVQHVPCSANGSPSRRPPSAPSSSSFATRTSQPTHLCPFAFVHTIATAPRDDQRTARFRSTSHAVDAASIGSTPSHAAKRPALAVRVHVAFTGLKTLLVTRKRTTSRIVADDVARNATTNRSTSLVDSLETGDELL